MNPDLSLLQPYPFERLAELKKGATPPADRSAIMLSIGEPKHASPQLVLDALGKYQKRISVYPKTKGQPELRAAIRDWAQRRFSLKSLDAETQILPVNGTREALFAFVQAAVDRTRNALVAMPNPFYQIYEGAALLAGAEPYFLPCDAANRYLPDFDAVPADVWKKTQVLFVCSPGNPTGAVIDTDTFCKLIRLADEHDFIIASDECYSELYFDENAPPPGLLQVCAAIGRHDYRSCVVFHSLSKRSNVPGMRSGFVAGDAALLEPFLLYRTYHGCAMSENVQLASIAAWQDEAHVRQNRDLYRAKFDAVLDILGDSLDVGRPDAGFYLWPRTPIDDTQFTRQLFASENVTVLPGQFLSREVNGVNPARNHVRIALVAELDECIEAAKRLRRFAQSL
jgi:N-succinyldiaminopimelate aminotransferase